MSNFEINDSWLRDWAMRCGIMLIVAFLLPMVTPFKTFWFWHMIKAAPVGTLLLLGVGVACVALTTVAKDKLAGNQLAVVLLVLSLLPLLSGMGGSSNMATMGAMGRGGMPMAGGANFGAILLLLSLCSIAIGNHLSKVHTQDQYPRLMVGIGGIVLLVLMILPIAGRSPITMFFSGFMWSRGWPVLLILAGVIAYGVIAVMQFFKIRGDMSELLSLVARGLLVGVPAVALFYVLVGPIPFFSGLMMVLKMILTVYGIVLLFVTSLTAVIEYNVGSGNQGAETSS